MGGTQDKLRASMNSTFANLRGGTGAQTDFGEQNRMANAGVYEPGSFGAQNAVANGTGVVGTAEQFRTGTVPVMQSGIDNTPLPTGREGLNAATGNILGSGLSRGAASGVSGLPVATQVAGVLSGMEDTGKVAAYQQRLMESGINLNAENQAPGDYQRNLVAARGIYDNVFGAGLPAGATGGPTTSYAPTGFRDRVMQANGGLVYGQGNVMGATDGKNAAGGNRFFLGQVTPMGANGQAPAPPPNPIMDERSAPLGSTAKAPSAYDQNAQAFKNHQVTQQMQAGLLKALPPGYMLDPDKPNAIKPIPGGPAEQKAADDKRASDESVRATHEAARQSVEKANITTKTINKILPQLNSMTTGVAAALTEAVPGTPAYNVGKLKDTVVANIGLKELKAMKEASKTGASGMGALSEKELAVLETSLGNLKLAQKTDQVAKAMKDVRNSFYRWRSTYNAGQLGETPEAMQRQLAVKWALEHDNDPRAEQILAMDEK